MTARRLTSVNLCTEETSPKIFLLMGSVGQVVICWGWSHERILGVYNSFIDLANSSASGHSRKFFTIFVSWNPKYFFWYVRYSRLDIPFFNKNLIHKHTLVWWLDYNENVPMLLVLLNAKQIFKNLVWHHNLQKKLKYILMQNDQNGQL